MARAHALLAIFVIGTLISCGSALYAGEGRINLHGSRSPRSFAGPVQRHFRLRGGEDTDIAPADVEVSSVQEEKENLVEEENNVQLSNDDLADVAKNHTVFEAAFGFRTNSKIAAAVFNLGITTAMAIFVTITRNKALESGDVANPLVMNLMTYAVYAAVIMQVPIILQLSMESLPEMTASVRETISDLIKDFAGRGGEPMTKEAILRMQNRQRIMLRAMRTVSLLSVVFIMQRRNRNFKKDASEATSFEDEAGAGAAASAATAAAGGAAAAGGTGAAAAAAAAAAGSKSLTDMIPIRFRPLAVSGVLAGAIGILVNQLRALETATRWVRFDSLPELELLQANPAKRTEQLNGLIVTAFEDAGLRRDHFMSKVGLALAAIGSAQGFMRMIQSESSDGKNTLQLAGPLARVISQVNGHMVWYGVSMIAGLVSNFDKSALLHLRRPKAANPWHSTGLTGGRVVARLTEAGGAGAEGGNLTVVARLEFGPRVITEERVFNLSDYTVIGEGGGAKRLEPRRLVREIQARLVADLFHNASAGAAALGPPGTAPAVQAAAAAGAADESNEDEDMHDEWRGGGGGGAAAAAAAADESGDVASSVRTPLDASRGDSDEEEDEEAL